MAIKDILKLIVKKHTESGIKVIPPATLKEISSFAKRIGFTLSSEFIEFYTTCNGFACDEDLFNMIPITEILLSTEHYGTNWFYFSEYMTFSDMWGLRLTTKGEYEIFNGSYPDIAMTSSLEEFLNRYLKGNIFDTDGLYDWHKELGIN